MVPEAAGFVGPGLRRMGSTGRLVLVTARRDEDILWAVEEGLRTGPRRARRRGRRDRPAADGGGPPAAACRRALRRHRTCCCAAGATPPRRRPSAIARTPPDPLADRRAALDKYRGNARDRPAALAGRIAAGARRRAGQLGGGGRRCDGSCTCFCRTGRSTGCAAHGSMPSLELAASRLTSRETVAQQWSRPGAAVCWPRSTRRGGGRAGAGHAAGRCAVVPAGARDRAGRAGGRRSRR